MRLGAQRWPLSGESMSLLWSKFWAFWVQCLYILVYSECFFLLDVCQSTSFIGFFSLFCVGIAFVRGYENLNKWYQSHVGVPKPQGKIRAWKLLGLIHKSRIYGGRGKRWWLTTCIVCRFFCGWWSYCQTLELVVWVDGLPKWSVGWRGWSVALETHIQRCRDT